MQKLRNQDVTLSTAHCHSASAHTDPMEKLLDQVQYLPVSGADGLPFIQEVFQTVLN